LDYYWLLESIGDAVIGLDATGTIVLWNPAAEATYGWKKEEVLGKPLAGLLGTRYDDPQENTQRARETVLARGVWRGKVHQKRKDGTPLVIESTVSTYPIDGGGPGLVAVNRDVTEKHRLEGALRRLEYLNRVLLRFPTLEEMFQAFATQTRDILAFDRLELWLLDETKSQVQVVQRFAVNRFTGLPLNQTCSLRETPLNIVQITRQTLLIPDLRRHSSHKGLVEESDRALLVFPLILNTAVIGGVAFFSRKAGAFHSSTADLLLSTIEQLALSIQQSRLMRSLQRQVEENSRLLRLSQEDSRRLQTVSEILIHTQERERQTLAREFHDQIGQSLTALLLNLRSIRRECSSSTPKIRETLDECIGLTSTLLEEVRTLSLELYPKILEDLGFILAMRWLLNRAEKLGHLQVDFTYPPAYVPLDRELEFGIFRIAQEAVTNILRHANARRVSVQLWQEQGSGGLRISDDGKGFEASFASAAGLPAHYFGFHSMFARAGLIHADLRITSSPDHGTTVDLQWNYGPSSETSSGG